MNSWDEVCFEARLRLAPEALEDLEKIASAGYSPGRGALFGGCSRVELTGTGLLKPIASRGQ